MRTLFPVAFFAATLVAGSPALAAPKICLDTRNIASSKPEDRGAAILFKMRDGSEWRNRLQGRCPDLVFEGFSWTVRNPDNSVCEDEQSLRVLRTGEVCLLGKFEKVTPAAKPG